MGSLFRSPWTKRALCFGLTLLALSTGVSRADEESPQLASYRTTVEQSIDKALDYLANQMLTGPELYKDVYGNTNAIAGLVGMAFLSRGYLPDDDSRYGRCINTCADYIFNSVDPKNKDSIIGYANGVRVDGFLGSERNSENMYGHAISVLFLSELSGMVDPERQKKIDAILPKAVKLLLDAQAVTKDPAWKGGWRYLPNSIDSDMSVTSWCVLALRSSRLNGAPVPDRAIIDAIKFIEILRSVDNSFGYVHSVEGGIAPRTGAAILSRELTGRHADEINRKAGDFILANLKSTGWGFITMNQGEYSIYYCSQAMFQLGGEYWEQYAEQMYKALLATQQKDGYWQMTGGVYPTAMCVLAMTVSCRLLPIYQR